MQKTFEIIAGVLILVFIGVVLWQMIDRESAGDFLGQEEFLIDQISDPGGSANEERIPEEFGYEIIPPEDAVVCSMEVMECPDGSFVGRAGPSCDFKDCLGGMLQEEDSVVVCSPEAKSNQICTRTTARFVDRYKFNALQLHVIQFPRHSVMAVELVPRGT